MEDVGKHSSVTLEDFSCMYNVEDVIDRLDNLPLSWWKSVPETDEEDTDKVKLEALMVGVDKVREYEED